MLIVECFSYMGGYRRGVGSKMECLCVWKMLIQIKKRCLHKDGAVSGWRNSTSLMGVNAEHIG